LARSSFLISNDWTELQLMLKTYFENNDFQYKLADEAAVFYVESIVKDMKFRLNCFPIMEKQFVIEFCKFEGDPFYLAQIFANIMHIFPSTVPIISSKLPGSLQNEITSFDELI
jgi:hypothetical protein